MVRPLCLGITVSLFTAASLWGVPQFVLPATVELEPGTSLSVPVSASSVASEIVQGMELYVQVDAPIGISDINFDGTIWPVQPPIVIIHLYPEVPYPQNGYASVVTPTPFIMPALGRVANVVISAPAGTPIGTDYLFRLEWPDFGVRSTIGPPSQIGPDLPTTVIHIIPEPATAALLGLSVALLVRWRR